MPESGDRSRFCLNFERISPHPDICTCRSSSINAEPAVTSSRRSCAPRSNPRAPRAARETSSDCSLPSPSVQRHDHTPRCNTRERNSPTARDDGTRCVTNRKRSGITCKRTTGSNYRNRRTDVLGIRGSGFGIRDSGFGSRGVTPRCSGAGVAAPVAGG